MKQQSSFSGWSFPEDWAIEEGKSFPYLAWQSLHKDLAPPLFADGYPAADNVDGSEFDLHVQTDEDATVYYLVLPDGASAPTAVQVKAGLDADGNPVVANRKGSLPVTAGSPAIKKVAGLNTATTYDIYLAAEDAAGNISFRPVRLGVTTGLISNANDIIGFTVANQVGESIIDPVNHTVEFHMPPGTAVTALQPTIIISGYAAITPLRNRCGISAIR